MASIFSNSEFRREWQEGTPANEGDLYVQLGLRKADRLFIPGAMGVSNPLKQRQKSFQCFQEASKQGNPKGMFLEGVAMLDGFGCKQDQQTGRALIQVAAVARGCPAALNFIGLCHFSSSPEQAVELFLQAHESGYKRATRNLGTATLYGQGIKQSYANAIKYYKQAGDIAIQDLLFVSNRIKQMRKRVDISPAKDNTPTNLSSFSLRA